MTTGGLGEGEDTMVKYSDLPKKTPKNTPNYYPFFIKGTKKIVLGHADAEIIEIIICRSNKEFLFWTHAEGTIKPRYIFLGKAFGYLLYTGNHTNLSKAL